MSTVRNRLLKSTGAGGLSLAARLMEQFLLVPVLLAAWSVELFGEWMLIAAIPVYIALLDFGVVQSGSNELARRASEQDETGVRRFFADYSSAFLLWSTLLFLLLAGLVLAAPVAQWLDLQQIGGSEAQAIFVLLIAATLVSQNSLALIAGLRARKLLPQGLMVRAVGAFARLGAAFVAVTLLDAGPIALAAILLVSRILEYGWQCVLLHRAELAPSWNILRKRSEPLREFVIGGLEFMLFPLAQSLVLQGAIVVVGLTYGAAAVALFATHRTLSRLVSQAVQLVTVPLRAEAGLIQNNRKELGAILTTASRITVWSALILAGVLFVAGAATFTLWTGGNISFAPTLFAVLLGATLAEALWSVVATIRMGTNRHRPLAWSYLVVSCAGLLAMVWLAETSDLAAMASVLMVIELAMVAIALPMTLRLLDIDLGRFLVDLAKPPVSEVIALVGKAVRMVKPST